MVDRKADSNRSVNAEEGRSETAISSTATGRGEATYRGTAMRIRAWKGRTRQRRRQLLFLSLFSLLLACRPPAPPAPQGPTTPRQPPPLPVSPPPPQQVTPTPPHIEPVVTGPLHVRVGLASDLATLELPCCDPGVSLEIGDAPWALNAAVRITPGGEVVERTVFRLQVAALKNEQQAEGIASYLADKTGQPADVSFDAGTDLYRVRVGSYETRQEAERQKGRLETLGLTQSWITSQGGTIADPHLDVQLAGKSTSVAGRWLDIAAPPDGGINFRGVHYRGKLLVFLNDRGRLNVINELPIEDYLRGVVPKEMGPSLYNRLEALKAQTVAARTYTLRNLGEFAQEGYDICSTPRCQVYQGMKVEHPVSDRAIRETAGQVVLIDGEPAETFYSSTCGGHTENVEVVFPLKSGTYLRGVPCVEAGLTRIQGDLASGLPLSTGLTRRLLPPTGGRRHKELSARLEHLAFLAHLPIPRTQLSSMRTGDILKHSFSVFDLALDERLLSAKDLNVLLANPPSDWRPQDRNFANYLKDNGWIVDRNAKTAAKSSTPGTTEVESLLYQLAQQVGVLRPQTAYFLSFEKGQLRVRRGAEQQIINLSHGSFATFRRQGTQLLSSPLELAAGDRLDLYWQGENLLALAQPTSASPVDLSRHARRLSWTRYKSLNALRTSVQARYPGFPFNGFEVMSRGVSGRVGHLKLLGQGGKSLDVEGLAVRWTLDVYDTLFYAQPHRVDNRDVGWTFKGNGWGHGVGMCQAGAYAMAVRGNTYQEILHHYYTGVDLARLKPSQERPRTAAAP